MVFYLHCIPVISKFVELFVFFCVQVYASPGEIALQMRRSGLDVPMFLLNISHPDHIPPHIVACELMATVNAQKQELHDLKLLIDKKKQNPSLSRQIRT